MTDRWYNNLCVDAYNGYPRWVRATTAIVAGVMLAASVPPSIMWPLVFVGVALWDRLLATSSARARFGWTFLITTTWLHIAMLWMWDLTVPGYFIASVLYAFYFATVALFIPPAAKHRRLVMPGAVALAELARWSFPFGGVPLANLALTQSNTPLGQIARLAGPLLVIMAIVVLGQALSATLDRNWTAIGGALAVVLVAILGAALHPRASVVDEVRAGVVQGGGPTRTRASSDQQPVVLARHVEATKLLETQPELILWPENVVNPGAFLPIEVAAEVVSQVAIDNNAVLMPGWFYAVNSGTATVNYQTAISAEGVELSRYDKVRIVPFGEYVPLRRLIERFSGELPARDVIPGTGPAVVDTPLGRIGVAISWEAFFDRRSRDSVRNGAQILTNPTNGSSFWLTQVHTQQVASNQLRAIETDRWLLMAGPTGMSAIIDADGNLLQRSGIGERIVLEETVELREGRTLSSIVGNWPALILGLASLVYGFRRRNLNV